VTAATVTAGTAGGASAAAGLLRKELAAGSDGAPADGEPAAAAGDERLSVYGDAAYGAGEFLAGLEAAGAVSMGKVQPPAAAGGRFTRDAFDVDLAARTVTCPAGQIAPLRRAAPGAMAYCGAASRPARWRPGAPRPRAGAPSAPAPASSTSRPPGPGSVTRAGGRATGRPGPRPNAKSGT
jgi:hypothetical protein